MPAYIAALAKRFKGARFFADDGGPTRRITDTLRKRDDFPADDRLKTLLISERAVADDNFLTWINETGGLKHDGSQVMRTAVSNAVTREFNGVARLDRDRSTAPIPSIIAASVAAWGYDHQPATTWVLA